MALADVEVEPGVHAGPTEVVGQQHQRRPLRVVHPVPRAADHGVHLVDGMVPFAAPRSVPRRRRPLAPRGLRLPLRQVLLRQPLHLPSRHGAHRAEDEPVVAVLALDEPQYVLAPEARHGLLRPKDVAAQRMAGEQHLLELVEDGIAGVVPPRVDLVDDDVALLGDLPLGKGRMEGDVGDQLHRAPEVLGQVGRRNPGLLLGGVSVELGPDAVQPVQDVECAALRRPLEERVFDEVREPVLAVQLIAGARFDQQAAVPDVAPVLEVHAPDAIGQRPGVEGRRIGRHGPRRYAPMGASAHPQRTLALADGALAAGALFGVALLLGLSVVGLVRYGGHGIEGQEGSVDGDEEEVGAAVHDIADLDVMPQRRCVHCMPHR